MSGLAAKLRRTLQGRGQKGYVLIELLVAMAIFGIISVGFLTAMVAGYHGVVVAHEQTMAQNLTRTTLENVRDAAYPVMDYTTTTSRFDVEVGAEYIDEDFVTSEDPTSVQRITVTVKHHGSGGTILATQALKVQP
ncbi:MAG: type II secretion system protein [Dehalococcoidia bacterium]|nr:type II secretion system protein [Dehalococcoidia bacterium]